jgi:hypothetical protein
VSFDSPYAPARQTPLQAVLGFLVLLSIIACGVGLWFGVPIAQQYPSKVAAPDSVLGLQRVTDDPDLALAVDRAKRGGGSEADRSLFAAAYTDAQHSQSVLVVAAAGFLLSREGFLDRLLGRASDPTDEVGEFVEVEAGELGGIAKCAYFRFKEWGKARGVLCGWADHGSFGLVFQVPADDIDIAARKMLDVRFAVETR